MVVLHNEAASNDFQAASNEQEISMCMNSFRHNQKKKKKKKKSGHPLLSLPPPP